ncbi:MAG: hypothetical protein J3K34DRAFT_9065 [Monoraphidium minutum]|nr:MAG: hypothetical protein J3K34DRAFT_9065 [Monoraphidium minutum]
MRWSRLASAGRRPGPAARGACRSQGHWPAARGGRAWGPPAAGHSAPHPPRAPRQGSYAPGATSGPGQSRGTNAGMRGKAEPHLVRGRGEAGACGVDRKRPAASAGGTGSGGPTKRAVCAMQIPGAVQVAGVWGRECWWEEGDIRSIGLRRISLVRAYYSVRVGCMTDGPWGTRGRAASGITHIGGTNARRAVQSETRRPSRCSRVPLVGA